MSVITGLHKQAGYFVRTGLKPDSPPEIVLSEDSETGRGNFILAHWTGNGHKLSILKGNCRRMYWRETAQEDFDLLVPGNLPANVINVAGHYRFIDPWQRREPLLASVNILDAMTARLRSGRRARKLVDIFWQTAKSTVDSTRLEFIADLNASLNAADEDLSGSKFLARMETIIALAIPAADDMNKVIAWVQSKTDDQLSGRETELVEELS